MVEQDRNAAKEGNDGGNVDGKGDHGYKSNKAAINVNLPSSTIFASRYLACGTKARVKRRRAYRYLTQKNGARKN